MNFMVNISNDVRKNLRLAMLKGNEESPESQYEPNSHCLCGLWKMLVIQTLFRIGAQYYSQKI